MKCTGQKTPSESALIVNRLKGAPTSRGQDPDVTEGGWRSYLDGQVAAMTALNLEFQQQYAAFTHNIRWRLEELDIEPGLCNALDNVLQEMKTVEQTRQKYADGMVRTILVMRAESAGMVTAIEEKEIEKRVRHV